MSKREYKIGNLKFYKSQYLEILQETREILIEINEYSMVNFKGVE